MREGVVSSLQAPDIVSGAASKKENAFMISRSLAPGDSGSPVIAIRDGKYEIVGLAQGLIREGGGAGVIGFAIKISVVKKILKANLSPEIFEKLGF